MRILKLSEENRKEIIDEAVRTVEKGGLIIYPTETCYGAGVDATNEEAVEKLLNYKTKRHGKAISIAIADKKMAREYVEINEIAENIYNNYSFGSLVAQTPGFFHWLVEITESQAKSKTNTIYFSCKAVKLPRNLFI